MCCLSNGIMDTLFGRMVLFNKHTVFPGIQSHITEKSAGGKEIWENRAHWCNEHESTHFAGDYSGNHLRYWVHSHVRVFMQIAYIVRVCVQMVSNSTYCHTSNNTRSDSGVNEDWLPKPTTATRQQCDMFVRTSYVECVCVRVYRLPGPEQAFASWASDDVHRAYASMHMPFVQWQIHRRRHSLGSCGVRRSATTATAADCEAQDKRCHLTCGRSGWHPHECVRSIHSFIRTHGAFSLCWRCEFICTVAYLMGQEHEWAIAIIWFIRRTADVVVVQFAQQMCRWLCCPMSRIRYASLCLFMCGRGWTIVVAGHFDETFVVCFLIHPQNWNNCDFVLNQQNRYIIYSTYIIIFATATTINGRT